jgi:predicted flap endonuclease-1-like 5' DNA nuclease
MSTFAAFIIGLLVGWVIEWIIDWVYWRRKSTPAQPEALERCRSQVTSLEQEIASYKSQLAALQADVDRSARVPVAQETVTPAAVAARTAEPIAAGERLETLRDLTAEMIQRLKQAGIDTVAKLGALVPKRLKEILGDLIPQPGGEVEIVRQARLASGMIHKADDLEVIVGIGPVIARMLNQAGIFTFAELAALSVEDLREIVGKQIQRLADESEILSQARQLAEKQNRGG